MNGHEVLCREKNVSVWAELSQRPGHCADSLSSSLVPHNPGCGDSVTPFLQIRQWGLSEVESMQFQSSGPNYVWLPTAFSF